MTSRRSVKGAGKDRGLRPTRRSVLAGLAAGATTSVLPVRAQQPQPEQAILGVDRHGISAFGPLKYPADFPNFDYVNPAAPKGGRLSFIGPAAVNNFDTFHRFILRGDAAQGLEYIHGTLLVPAFDEPDAYYGLVAQSVNLAPDRRSVTFKIRPEARFSDGSPVTADDCVYTFDAIKENGHPAYRFPLRDVTKAEALDRLTVRYTFTGDQLRDLPISVGASLPVLSRAYYKTQPFDQTSLQPPVSCGPYAIGPYEAGKHITYQRRKDYWAANLPVVKGHFNFDELRYEYFSDRSVALLNLKGGNIDLREEYTARDWATAYDIPAVKDGRLRRYVRKSESPTGAQGWYINLRRPKFADPRVRKAIDYAFNFEWTNRNIFFDLYERTQSYFENTDLKAVGPPTAAERTLLEPFKAELPAEVFGEPYIPPRTDGQASDRRVMGDAHKLLEAAGFAFRDGKRINGAGVVLDIEFLSTDPTSERVTTPFINNLRQLGIQATIRRVDAAQYERRRKSYDYDVMTARLSINLTPGKELWNYYSSAAGAADGSFNLSGINSKAVDALVDAVTAARSRPELVTACRALDRVLRAGHYWVSNWHKTQRHLVFWDKFGLPPEKPRYERGPVNQWWSDTWWHDAERAAKLGRQGQ